MKSLIISSKPNEERYPILKINKHNGCIALFISDRYGICIHRGNATLPHNVIREELTEEFEFFNGSIILSNE